MTAAPLPELRGSVRVTLPLKTVNESNQRSLSHWPRTHRAKRARSLAGLVVGQHWKASALRLPVVVTLTRISPGTLDDDGVCSALKATRDGVADALGVDDRTPHVEWRYAQRKGSPKDATLARGYGVTIAIQPA